MTTIKDAGSMPERDCQHSENETRNAPLPQVAAASLESEVLYSKTNSLSPIDQLPAEIKVEIFHNALLNGRTIDPLITPFFLGKICRGWRDFIWSSPILWTNLHLCLSKDRYEAQTSLLRDWLSRIAKYPLCFRLTPEDPDNSAWTSGPLMEILTMFVSVSVQWKEIEFFLPDNQDCFDAISAAAKSLPLLTTAAAYLDSNERQLNLFSTAPQLSVLHLYDPFLFMVPAPWHQLRVFISHRCTVDEIRGFLNKAANIIRCSFRYIVLGTLNDSPEPDVFDQLPVLEHLEYLELSFDESPDTSSTWILGSVKLPSLREVYIHGPFAYSPETVLPAFMTSFNSSHLLEKFTFGGNMASHHHLIRVLESIPSIKDLCLNFREQHPRNELLTKELLQQLLPSHTDIFLPNLRSFTYIGPTSLNEHIHLFRDVLVYRFRRCTLRHTESDSTQRPVSQIQSVAVTSSSKLVISRDIRRELNSLIQEGLVLSLTSTYQLHKDFPHVV